MSTWCLEWRHGHEVPAPLQVLYEWQSCFSVAPLSSPSLFPTFSYFFLSFFPALGELTTELSGQVGTKLTILKWCQDGSKYRVHWIQSWVPRDGFLMSALEVQGKVSHMHVFMMHTRTRLQVCRAWLHPHSHTHIHTRSTQRTWPPAEFTPVVHIKRSQWGGWQSQGNQQGRVRDPKTHTGGSSCHTEDWRDKGRIVSLG